MSTDKDNTRLWHILIDGCAHVKKIDFFSSFHYLVPCSEIVNYPDFDSSKI